VANTEGSQKPQEKKKPESEEIPLFRIDFVTKSDDSLPENLRMLRKKEEK
jgi:hypothetical protein